MSLAKYLMQKAPSPRVTFIGATVHENAGAPSAVVPPAGVENGDLLVVQYCGSSTPVVPSGWVKRLSATNYAFLTGPYAGETSFNFGNGSNPGLVMAAFRLATYGASTQGTSSWPIQAGFDAGDMVVAGASRRHFPFNAAYLTDIPTGYELAGLANTNGGGSQASAIYYKLSDAASEAPPDGATDAEFRVTARITVAP